MKPKEPKKSPTIYRYFTEWYVWPLTFSIVLVLLISILGLRYVQLNTKLKKAQEEKHAVIQEVQFWEKVVVEYPDYRDAYFKLALLSYQLGDTKKSKENIQKSLQLDPNFEKGRDFEELLITNY